MQGFTRHLLQAIWILQATPARQDARAHELILYSSSNIGVFQAFNYACRLDMRSGARYVLPARTRQKLILNRQHTQDKTLKCIAHT